MLSSAVVPNLSVGSHTVAFNNIAGWTVPSSQTANITNGTTASLSGAYLQQTGSLTVTISPAVAVTAGAMWNVDGGGWQASGTTVSGITVGSHAVAFNNIAGWTTPSGQTANITNGTTTSLSSAYVQQTGSLTVTISPAGAVTEGAMWNVDGGAGRGAGQPFQESQSDRTRWLSIISTAGPRHPVRLRTSRTGRPLPQSGHIQLFLLQVLPVAKHP